MVWWVEILSGWNGVVLWWMVGWVVGGLNNEFSTPHAGACYYDGT